MANWIGVITNGGNDLLNEWVSERELRFDSAAAGSGTVAVASMMAQTALAAQKQEASIIGADKVDGGVRLKLRISAHETGYILNQYGVWASLTGGDSILVALFQHEQGIQVPSKNESPDFVYTFYALIGCSNTGTWTVNIDTSAVVSGAEMDRAIAEATNGLQPKITTSGLLKGDGKGNITAAAGGTDYAWPTLSGSGAPTQTTKGETMQRYHDTATDKEYVCTGKSADGKYVWKLSGGGDEVPAHASNHATGGSDPITPESIGAAPAGYGLGGGATKIDNLNNAVNNGWYLIAGTVSNGPKESIYGWMLVSSRSGSGGMIRQDFWEAITNPIHYVRYAVNGEFKEWEYVNPPMASGIEYRTTERYKEKAVYKKLDTDGVIKWRLDGEDTWKPEAESIGAAPAGYGLGDAGKQVTDLNDAQDSGFYSAIGAANLPPNVQSAQYASVLVLCSQKDRVTQVYFQDVTGGDGAIAVRRLNGNGWSEWEFINSPMRLNVEYRTTERYNQKAVYKKLDTDGVIKWRVDGETTWHTDKLISKSVTLSASAWNSTSKTQTVTVSGVLADETKQLITPTPALASQAAYYDAVILCTGQAADQLTFTAKKVPTNDLTVYVTIQEVGA